MLRAEIERLAEGRLPRIASLAGDAVHEIEADVLESGLPRLAKCPYRFIGRVYPAEQAQLLVIERLNSQAQTVER